MVASVHVGIVSSKAVDQLRRGVLGTVWTGGDAGYDDAHRIWNATADRRPAVVVGCRGVADVMRARSDGARPALITHEWHSTGVSDAPNPRHVPLVRDCATTGARGASARTSISASADPGLGEAARQAVLDAHLAICILTTTIWPACDPVASTPLRRS